ARHPGMDIDGDTGDAVVAAAAGRVVHAGPAPAGYSGYGTVVILDHGALTTIYAHLSKVAVAAGEDVVPGQHIGAIGTTGSVTGSHLHFELRRGGVAVDPKGWLPGR
ncbi:MAG: murein hydrolase activator EnvC family protein, partial [Actinomycetes bacterium]